MDDNFVYQMTIQCIHEIISENDELEGISVNELNEKTNLLGEDAILDSLGLVSAIVNIEQALKAEFEIDITIADERALMQKNSPFKTIGRLSEYIESLIKEYKQNE